MKKSDRERKKDEAECIIVLTIWLIILSYATFAACAWLAISDCVALICIFYASYIRSEDAKREAEKREKVKELIKYFVK